MRVLKYVGIALGVLVALLAIALAVVWFKPPSSRAPITEKVEATPERLERGKYLVTNVSACFNCHGERDWKAGGAPVPGTEGAPGFCLTEEHGFPGTLCGPNISSHATAGIGGWTDGEILRALREGVSKDGRGLFPMMPYGEFASMSDEDARAVVAYLRTLPPQEKAAPAPKLGFPLNLMANLIPSPLEGEVKAPSKEGTAGGEYLTALATCRGCHSGENAFGGGFEFNGPWGKLVSPNISPDPEGYVGKVSREQFIARFKAGAVGAPSPMPWAHFAGMTDADLGAIYDYLRTVPAVKSQPPQET